MQGSRKFERALKLFDEGIRLKAPGNVLNLILFSRRSRCQWELYHCTHAILDAAIAAQLDCAGSDRWEPAYNSGMAWGMMGISSSAVQVCSHLSERQLLTMIASLLPAVHSDCPVCHACIDLI